MNPSEPDFSTKPSLPSAEQEALEREHFVQGLIARGEAVEVADAAALAPGATHEIIGRTEDGLPIVQRRRLSLS